jgi:uncharacterized membrane protein YhaH (DUF805 family)
MTILSPPPPLAPSGRLAPWPFVFAVAIVDLLSFASQVLLSPQVTSSMNVVPFVLAQAVLIVLWIKLHVYRLRDAGRSGGLAVGVAAVYALEVVLFTILVSLIIHSAGTTDHGTGREATILHLFVVLYFLSLMTGDPTLGALQVWMMGFAVLMLLPLAIALVFSLWTATRPRVP